MLAFSSNAFQYSDLIETLLSSPRFRVSLVLRGCDKQASRTQLSLLLKPSIKCHIAVCKAYIISTNLIHIVSYLHCTYTQVLQVNTVLPPYFSPFDGVFLYCLYKVTQVIIQAHSPYISVFLQKI